MTGRVFSMQAIERIIISRGEGMHGLEVMEDEILRSG